MKITLDARKPGDVRVDLLVIAAGKDWKAGEIVALDRRLGGRLAAEIEQQGFKGAAGDVALFQTHGALPARYVLVVGGDGDAAGSGVRRPAEPPA